MYQCYYYKTYGKRQYLGEKILTKTFERELDAEIYCSKHEDVDMNYEEIE